MRKLIEALQILDKYNDYEAEKPSWHTSFPTHCEHDVLLVFVDNPHVSDEDAARLDELGFHYADEEANGGDPCWSSYHFGSC